ncbi:MAG: hypothetical protein ACK5ME_05815 [Parahaliea sp.]
MTGIQAEQQIIRQLLKGHSSAQKQKNSARRLVEMLAVATAVAMLGLLAGPLLLPLMIAAVLLTLGIE